MKLNYNPFENFSNGKDIHNKLGKIKSNLEEYQHPQETPSHSDTLEQKIEKPNFILMYCFVFVFSLLMIFRLLDLQIAQGAKHEYLAEGNRVRSKDIVASRGNIYDKNEKILAKNIASFNLELFPADLPKEKQEREKIYSLLKENIDINTDELRKKIDDIGLFSLDSIVLKENIDRDEALILEVKFKNISGLEISKKPMRYYEVLPGLSHILGYVGKVNEEELHSDPNLKLISIVGKSGIELIYNSELTGEFGKEQVEVDSKGQIQRILATLDPTPGDNLYLSIDYDLQKKIADTLHEKIKQVQASKGVVIAMNPQDGSILSLVNIPSYDNNIFSSADRNIKYEELLKNENKPMLNRAISGAYPSGSVIKPIVASAGLQEGVISSNTTIYAPKEIQIGNWVYPDWKEHGYVNTRKAIAVSSNVFFYAVGGGYDKIQGLGLERLRKYFEEFGFGELTGIDLNGENKGLIPSNEWKKKVKNEPWYQGDTYHLSIGQGDFLTTPIQMLNATSAIANGGKLLKPKLVKKMTNWQGELIYESQKEVIRSDFISSENIQIVREGMRQAVTDGSARSLQDLPISSAGKTGTAQTSDSKKTHAWFTTFAPYENPEIALVVLIEHGGEGSDAAVPVAKDILRYYFENKKEN